MKSREVNRMNRWKSAIMGVVVGDALGCPVQFESRETVARHPVTGMRGYGTFNLPAGSWTDDSALTLALLESIVVGAIPVGGMTGELLICAVLGLDPSFAAALLIIGTICDIPATLLNVAGNLVAPLLVQRLSGRRAP